MHGGVKFYRGSAAAARAYVEADHSRADDYYLAEGSGVAERTPSTSRTAARDCKDRRARGDAGRRDLRALGRRLRRRHRQREGPVPRPTTALRFVEVVVNGPKTWSLAAALHPEIAAAYDAAQDRAAVEIIGWLAEHATTSVGPRDDRSRCRSSRSRPRSSATTPRAPATRTVTSTSRSTRGCSPPEVARAPLGRHPRLHRGDQRHRSRRCHVRPGVPRRARRPRLHPRRCRRGRAARAVRRRFSHRAPQITRNIDRYEAEWRADHPGEEPGPKLRRSGTGARGPTHDPTRLCPPTAPSWSRGGTTSCTTSASARRRQSSTTSGPPSAGLRRPSRSSI